MIIILRFLIRNNKNKKNNKYDILFGLGAIKGVGESALESIFEAREKEGEFTSLYGFCEKLDLRKVNKRVLESLIKSGALDSFGGSREDLLANLPAAMKFAEQETANKKNKQDDLFANIETKEIISNSNNKIINNQIKWGLRDKLLFEKEVLGFCLSGSLLDVYTHELKKLKLAPLSEINRPDEIRRAVNILLCGVVKDIRKMKSKKGNWFNILLLDDGKTQSEILLFDDAMPLDPLLEDDVIMLEASLSWDKFRNRRRVKVNLIQNIEKYRGYNLQKLCIYLKSPKAKDQLPKLKELLSKAESDESVFGEAKLSFVYEHDGVKAKFVPCLANNIDNKSDNKSDNNKIGKNGINITDKLLQDLKLLLGDESIELLY